jgi:hypothetical protein
MSAERLRAGATFDRAMLAGSEDYKIRDPHYEFMRRSLPARLVVIGLWRCYRKVAGFAELL